MVTDLISLADVIVSEFQLLSDAVQRELSIISHHQKRDRTIIVLPGQEYPFAWLGMHPTIQEFWRVAHYHELPQYDLVSGFFFRELIEHCNAVWHARIANNEHEPVPNYHDFASRLHLLGRSYYESDNLDYALMHILRSARLLAACGSNAQATAAMMDCTAIMIASGDSKTAERFLAEADRLAADTAEPELLRSLADLRAYYCEMCG